MPYPHPSNTSELQANEGSEGLYSLSVLEGSVQAPAHTQHSRCIAHAASPSHVQLEVSQSQLPQVYAQRRESKYAYDEGSATAKLTLRLGNAPASNREVIRAYLKAHSITAITCDRVRSCRDGERCIYRWTNCPPALCAAMTSLVKYGNREWLDR